MKNILSTQIDLSKFKKEDFEEISDVKKEQTEVIKENRTYLKASIRRLKKNSLAMFSMITLIVILVIIIFAPFVIPYGYAENIRINGKRVRDAKNLAPFTYSVTEQEYMNQTGERLFPHIMGTDNLSRDYFIRVIYGTRVSLIVGVLASVLVLIIGMFIGSIAGYYGGKTDLAIMRMIDIIYSLPDMLLIILISVVFGETLTRLIEGTILAKMGANMLSLFIVYALLYWGGIARIIRGQILSIKKKEYIIAARALGEKPASIIKKHLLPNCLSVIIISMALQIPGAIFTESYLSFIGLGIQAPMPSLGSLINIARENVQTYSYKLAFPAIIICLIVLALNLLGDGIRDAFDPKL